MTILVELAIEAIDWDSVADMDPLVQRAVDEAARTAGIALADGAEVSVLLCDDGTIQNLNREWRGFDKPTNVLSFPSLGPQSLHEKPLLGDIAIAFETARREADQEGKSLSEHLSHLVVHGFLHLIGYDHEIEADATAMETLETRILAALGIADPYAESDPVEHAAP